MLKNSFALSTLALLLLLGGSFVLHSSSRTYAENAPGPNATSNRWIIQRADIAVSAEGKEPARSATNSFLLDTHTGDTWMLWPTGDRTTPGYGWIKVSRKE